MRQPGPILAPLVIALLVLIWGTTWAAIRISLEGFPPLTGVALRFAVASAVLLIFARAAGIPLRGAGRREWGLRLGHGVLSFGISYGVVFWAEQWVPSGLAAVIFATFSLFVVVMARVVLPEERLGFLGLAGVVIGLAGVAVIYGEDLDQIGGPQVAFASVILLASPIASAAANVAVKRWGRDVHPVSLNAWAMGMGSVGVGVVALFAEADRPIIPTAGPVLALLYMAVLGSALTFSLYYWLLQYLSVSRLSLIAYATPVVAVAIGVGVLDEPLTPRIVVGALLVVAGVAAAVRGRRTTPAAAHAHAVATVSGDADSSGSLRPRERGPLTDVLPQRGSCPPAKFGTVLGEAPGGVEVHSSHYPSADPAELPDRRAFRSEVDGLYMGYKWQCVELARRFLYLNFGYLFADVGMAYEIFRLRHVRRVADGRLLPLASFRNGSKRRPEPGCLLVWDEGGDFEATGHVAVVTEVADDRIRFVEQNVDDCVWSEGRRWSRELPAHLDGDGGYHVRCSGAGTSILGWVIQTADDRHAEPPSAPDPHLLALLSDRVPSTGQAQQPWLDLSRPEEAAYVAALGGHRLAGRDDDQHLFFCLSETAARELRHATNELHAMFVHATGLVLDDDEWLSRFNIPPVLWPRLRWSWNNRRHQLVTGRFDFAMSERGLKLYEYNADSAACHLECGRIQGRWAEHFGCARGRDSGADLFDRLVTAWHGVPGDGPLHLMLDDDPEELYHTLFMRSALEAAGWQCRLLRGLADLRWDENGRVVDRDGAVVQRVWKTWAWETALEQLRADLEGEPEAPRPGRRPARSPRLVDVLLHPEVVVHEPLWTLVPSNKAILPVLWRLFPDHPYLLNTQYELDDALRASGYVAKPIAGRAGANVRLVGPGDRTLTSTHGRFRDQDRVFQELFPLPVVDGRHVQVSTFPVEGRYAGCCVRVDPSPVITAASDVLPLRIVADDELRER